ncbi:hypothetical protein BDU57DRAFT_542012 [Ampelomyces quisqualis]|uniref:Uncharacterized protein n=1 Tax=Ampelomyces quisqualis TaxID=50730 RepID=A0A6A5QFU8_AMPQU|nr:hypothetical protein BDU57DRAFT_542012 [Ampelomyces quisqualis]
MHSPNFKMQVNSFELFALLLCSCLFGIILAIYSMSNLVSDREIMLMSSLYITMVIFFFMQQHNKKALVEYLARHSSDIEKNQIMDLQESHRRRILSLKTEHVNEVRQLQSAVLTASAKFDRVNTEYNWMSDAYQDQMRTIQEQQDRIDYIENKLREFGQTTPTTQQPFSAPATQIAFAAPPRRQFFDFGTPGLRPLSQVVEASEAEGQ